LNCWRVQILLAAYTDGELGRSESEQVHEHLERCVECRAQAELVLAVPADLSFPRYAEEHEDELWSELDRRIHQGLKDDRARPLAPAGSLGRAAQALAAAWYGNVSLPGPAAAAYAALLVLLVGWSFHTWQNAQAIEAALEASSEQQRAMEQRVAALVQDLESQQPNNAQTAARDAIADDRLPPLEQTLPIPVYDSDFAPQIGGRVYETGASETIGPVLIR